MVLHIVITGISFTKKKHNTEKKQKYPLEILHNQALKSFLPLPCTHSEECTRLSRSTAPTASQQKVTKTKIFPRTLSLPCVGFKV